MKDNEQEIFPVVDEAGKVVGKATRGECHSGSKLLHPVVHLHVFNKLGDVYLQKRPEWKDIQPGKWDTAVGGHIDYGETPEEALQREVREELCITEFVPEFVDKYVFESQRERELVYVHRTTYEGEIRPSKDELDGGRFWTMQEIREAMGQGMLTPNFESEFQRFFLKTNKTMNIGDKAPEILGKDEQGRDIRLSDYKGRKLVLYFYPKDNTSGCTAEACSLRDHYSELQGAGYEVVGVSKDSAASHVKFKEKYELPFPLIADVNHELLDAMGAWGEKNMYGKKTMGTIRTTFIINEEGIIEQIFAGKQVKTKEHAEQILSGVKN